MLQEEGLGGGSPWLTLEDDYLSHPKTGKKTIPSKKKSLVVSLPTVGMMKEEVNNDQSEATITHIMSSLLVMLAKIRIAVFR